MVKRGTWTRTAFISTLCFLVESRTRRCVSFVGELAVSRRRASPRNTRSAGDRILLVCYFATTRRNVPLGFHV